MFWNQIDDVPEFEEPRRPNLPANLILQGEAEGHVLLPFELDGDRRLVFEAATPKFVAQSVQAIPTTPGLLTGGAGWVYQIDICNTTNAPIGVTLYHTLSGTVSAADVIALCGAPVPANGLLTWQGGVPIGSRQIWGAAGAPGLRYMASMHAGVDYVR